MKTMKLRMVFFTLIGCLSVTQMKAQTEVTFYTSEGTFIAMMYDSIKPITAGNFISLVDSGFYDAVIFHRVIKNFVIQGGDPTGTGFGGPGYTIPDEFDSTGTLSNTTKTLSMANSGPNTGGSQFFINLVNNTYLDFDKPPLTSKHPVFGVVVYNWGVVQKIANVAVNASDKPIIDVVMDSLRVTPANIGLNEVLANRKIHIYPNPATSSSRLFLYSDYEGVAGMKVYNSTGALVYNQNLELKTGNNAIKLQDCMSRISSTGVYTISVKLEDQVHIGKLVIQN